MGAAPSAVRVLRVAPLGEAAYADENFAEVAAGSAARVAALAAAASGWGAPSRVALFLVPGGRERALAIRREPRAASDIIRGEPLAPDEAVAAGAWLLARVSRGAAPDAGGGAALLVELRALLQEHVSCRHALAESETAASPAAYEVRARIALPATLARRCGLLVVADAATHRTQPNAIDTDGTSFEWDFRAPVTLLPDVPAAPATDAEFLIYPNCPRYDRPPRPPALRNLTPTKGVGGATTACDFVAIFEVTTNERWSRSLLKRLERRLRVSLDRARSQPAVGVIDSVLDVVAVIGVVSPHNCLQSVVFKLCEAAPAEADALRELRIMAGASRFVWIGMELSPSETADE